MSTRVGTLLPVTEIVPGITADPTRAFGKPVIAGTRVSAATVLGLLAAGRPDAEILAGYDLTTERSSLALAEHAVTASGERAMRSRGMRDRTLRAGSAPASGW